MAFCACDGVLMGTGTPSKQKVINDGVILIAVQLKADDGTANVILSTDVIDQAFVDAKINEEDPSKRWNPIGEFDNVEDLRADATTETFNNGSSAITQQGVRTYLGWLVNFAPKYIDNIKGLGCTKFGLYIVDRCGNLQGSVSQDGLELKPVRVFEPSWNPTFDKASATISSKVKLGFEFSQLEADANLRVIEESEITAELLDIEGLVNLNGAVSSITTTGFVLALTVDYDDFLDLTEVEAWVLADYALFNETDNLSIVITSVTEAPVGTYTFVIPAQTSADIMTLTNLKTTGLKPGLLLEETITIP